MQFESCCLGTLAPARRRLCNAEQLSFHFMSCHIMSCHSISFLPSHQWDSSAAIVHAIQETAATGTSVKQGFRQFKRVETTELTQPNAGHGSRILRLCAFPMRRTKTIDCHCYAGATFLHVLFLAVVAMAVVQHCIIPHQFDPNGVLKTRTCQRSE